MGYTCGAESASVWRITWHSGFAESPPSNASWPLNIPSTSRNFSSCVKCTLFHCIQCDVFIHPFFFDTSPFLDSSVLDMGPASCRATAKPSCNNLHWRGNQSISQCQQSCIEELSQILQCSSSRTAKEPTHLVWLPQIEVFGGVGHGYT
jgi:hypothetical protein